MARFRPGDEVVATKEIGGVMRSHVPKGSRGVVVAAGWATRTRVLFTVSGFLGSRGRRVEVTVDEREIA